MSKNQYYYYDEDRCSFVELEPSRTQQYRRWVGLAAIALVLAVVLSVGFDAVTGSPEELALQAENQALQQQLSQVHGRVDTLSTQLETLVQTDRDLYRTLLEADPISEDVRQVGIGGADPYERFDRFRPETATLLRQTSGQLEQLERQVSLQNMSYRELTRLAMTHQKRLAEMPAILPTTGSLVSGYGVRMHPILNVRRMHHGIDFAVDIGTPVYATGDGIVKDIGRSSGYGRFVVIRHPNAGYETLFGHLSAFADGLYEGKRVKRGDLIAKSGNSGRSTGPHLHYEVRNLDGRTFNPMRFLVASMPPQQYKEMLAAAEHPTASLD